MAKRKRVAQEGGSAGLTADAAGNPAIDPTENVKALTQAEARRQDDLRDLESQHIRQMLAQTERMASVTAECAKEVAVLRDQHNKEMRKSEADRLNAIREVDVQAVQRAAGSPTRPSDRARDSGVRVGGDVARLVSAAATVQATALATALSPLTEAISELRESQYKLQGEKAGAFDMTTDRRFDRCADRHRGRGRHVPHTPRWHRDRRHPLRRPPWAGSES